MTITDVNKLEECIIDLKNHLTCNNIMSLNDFSALTSFTTIQDEPYNPSTGEKAILSINNFLENFENDYFILDEIEAGFENKYINDILICKINELISQNKTIIISTHNANLAVRTLPINTIMRKYSNGKFELYSGNMFTDTLINKANNTTVSWRKETLNTLEGCEEAFQTRRIAYGIK